LRGNAAETTGGDVRAALLISPPERITGKVFQLGPRRRTVTRGGDEGEPVAEWRTSDRYGNRPEGNPAYQRLGFIGLLASSAHHQMHHLMMVKGEFDYEHLAPRQ